VESKKNYDTIKKILVFELRARTMMQGVQLQQVPVQEEAPQRLRPVQGLG
jgi:hypothetical protein